MTIRQATEDDIFDLLILGRQFIKESGYKWDRERVEEIMNNLISNDESCIIVYEVDGEVVGGLLGTTAEPFLSHQKQAHEMAWFVDKDHRDNKGGIGMMKAFEEWAKDLGCTEIIMGDIVGVRDLTNLYEHKGYKMVEKLYSKEI